MTTRSLPHLHGLVSHLSDRLNARTIGRVVMIGSTLFNTGLVGASLAQHKYDAAGTQLVLVAILVTWCALTPKLDAWLDTRMADAVAQRRTTEIALSEMERMQARGELRVGVSVQGRADRMH